MPKTTKWDIPPHTHAKHRIVQEYLYRWLPIMSKHNKRLVYFDGFSGPGRYSGGEDGSPLVALRALLDHRSRSQITAEIVFLFVEADRERYDSLVAELAGLEAAYGGWPPNVKIHHRNASFVDEASSIINSLKSSGSRLAPTFALIDPFGFSGVPMQVIAELLGFPRCELLFNLIFDPINWHLNNEKVAHHMRDLFGCDDFNDIEGMTGVDRRNAILDLYTRQLKDITGFQFVQTFEMINDRNRLGTVLVAGTRHPLGFAKIKEAMWAVDTTGSFTFSDLTAGMIPLIDGPNYAHLENQILLRYRGRAVAVEEIERFVIEETKFLKTHYKRGVFVPLERAEQIRIPSPRRKTLTYPPGTVIQFEPFG
jgi:three-Cys-motif partner protein